MRTNITDVRLLMEETEVSDDSIETYITTANKLVTGLLGATPTSEALLTEIERHIAAHFVASYRERLAKREKAGEAEVEYQGEFKAGLHSTPFGQTAMMLDVTGTLATMFDKRARMVAVKS
jgi:hypothetical protein